MIDSKPPLTGLPEKQRRQALERYGLLKAYLNDGVPLSRVARALGLPLRTLQRWEKVYREQGMVGLARQPRRDQGKLRHVAPELVELIEGLALRQPPLSLAAVHRQVLSVAKQHAWPAPGYRRVYAIAKRIDPALLTLAHAGTKAYRQAFDLLHRREASKPNEIWQADHTQLDIWALNPNGTLVRPWLTVIVDDYSRAIASFGLSVHAPSAIQTALVGGSVQFV